jgi:hypothetical protein
MTKLYEEFFDICKRFDKFVQEEKWKKVKDFAEFRSYVDNEFQFWKRVLTMLPPEQRLLKEFEWLTQCYKQIKNNLKDEQVNRKMRWIAKKEDKKETV